MPTYTLSELRDFLYSKDEFHILYDNWKRLDYQKDYVPSVDRIDSRFGYSLSNITLMTWRENYMKEHIKKIEGEYLPYSKQQKPVAQIDSDGRVVSVFASANAASRAIGITRQNIQSCCYGRRSKAGGFKWSFTTIK